MDYSQGKIYKITADDMTYYGSTIHALSRRFSRHKINNKTSSKIIMDTGKAIIELVENFPCQSQKELRIRERFWIENNKCVNKQIPNRTKAEYRQSEKNITCNKNFYIKNRDKILKERKEKITCECGKKISKYTLQRHKQSKKHQAWILKSNHNIECMS